MPRKSSPKGTLSDALDDYVEAFRSDDPRTIKRASRALDRGIRRPTDFQDELARARNGTAKEVRRAMRSKK